MKERFGDSARAAAIEILMELRNAGISADMDLMGRNMGKAMKYANNIGVKTVIIIGEKELENKMLAVKNMESGQQEEVPIQDIVQYFE